MVHWIPCSFIPMPTNPLRLCIGLLLTLHFLLPHRAAAQGAVNSLLGGAATGDKKQGVKASLVAANSAWVPGQPMEVALKLVHPEHWHTYWLNPGVGTPTKLAWTLPAGWTASPLRWPVPKIKGTELGNQHIYEDTTWLFTTVTPPVDVPLGTNVELTAAAKWLVCDEGSVCMPGGSPLALSLPVAAAATPVPDVMSALDKVNAAQPVTVPAWEVKLEPKWIVTLTPKAGANPDPGDIYVFDRNKAISLQPQKVLREAGVIKIRLEPHEDAETAAMPAGFVYASKGWLQDGSVSSLTLAPSTTDAPIVEKTGSSSPAPEVAAPLSSRITFWSAVFSLFAAGMILNLMPCVFPVLALKVLSFARQAGKDPVETRKHSLAYTLGLLVFVWLVAGGMLLAKSAFGLEFAWGDLTRYTGPMAGVVIVLFLLGLNLAGLFEIGTSLSTVGGDLQDRKGYAGSFWSGALTMLISTPCSGPFMAVAMGYALQQPVLSQFVLFTSFGLGIAFPYVLLSSSPALLKKLPRPGAWMETFKKALAFPMFAAAVYFFNTFTTKAGESGSSLLLWSLLFIALAAWIYGHWCVPSRTTRTRMIGGLTALLISAAGVWFAVGASREKASDQSSSGKPYMTGTLSWTKWSPEALAAERAKGRAVFVNYTTLGCITCDTNELRVFKSPGSSAVIDKFKELNVAPLRAKYLADGTPDDNAIRNSLKPWDISTFPAYIMYPADPSKGPFLVSDSLLSQQEVITALEKAVK